MEFIFAICAYLVGSIPFAKIIAARHGVDIQKVGSGNIGFANVERVMGLKHALPVLVGDIAKGLLPVLVAKSFFDFTTLQLSIIGACAIVGHVFPIWLRFKGGKAIATSIGVAAGLNIVFGGVAFVVYVLFRRVFKDAAFRSLATILCMVVVSFGISSPFRVLMCLDFIFVIWTHRSNLKNFWQQRKHAS